MKSETQVSTDTTVSTIAAPSIHTEGAEARLQELRVMRETIPNFVIPTKGETQRLASAASVPPEFVELTAALVKRGDTLGTGSPGADIIRDRMTFADAYGPVADEFDAMAQFLRHSIVAARNEAGSAALDIYSATKRLSKRPRNAELVPHVADMARALGIRSRNAKAKAAARQKAEEEKGHGTAATPATTPAVIPTKQ